MIGQKIHKPVNDWNAYTQAALWCNANRATLENKGGYYEIIALPEPSEPTLEEARAEKLAELNAAFGTASREAHCPSSLGFEVNADETANRNVSSLIVAVEASGEESVPFCAYDNTFHSVTVARLKTLQLEIIARARAIYAWKWAMREAIAAAKTREEREALELNYEGRNQ